MADEPRVFAHTEEGNGFLVFVRSFAVVVLIPFCLLLGSSGWDLLRIAVSEGTPTVIPVALALFVLGSFVGAVAYRCAVSVIRLHHDD